MDDQDYEIIERTPVFQGYFRIDRYRVRHRKFDGGWTDVFPREVFERGHAVGVLLFDPVRDRVVLIEQFRVGAVAAGKPAWLLEVVAGIIEEGEAPEAVARREAVEESGCTINRIERICDYLVSPGGTSESVALFCGEVDSEGAGGTHGVAGEMEDIQVRAVSTRAAFRLLDQNKINNSVTVIALLWLARNKAKLKKRWVGIG